MLKETSATISHILCCNAYFKGNSLQFLPLALTSPTPHDAPARIHHPPMPQAHFNLLTVLDLSRNNLTSASLISTSCGKMSAPLLGALTPNLQVLRLHHNKLTNMIPLYACDQSGTNGLVHLRELWLTHNCLEADSSFVPSLRWSFYHCLVPHSSYIFLPCEYRQSPPPKLTTAGCTARCP